ncbi:dihydrolipoyl dehydrogenase (macronuclear) [Tetrahymena thermophila SB210]|uniref:Dihydrolipoyl dehydrogenase n=1 Tax=Tetrahymena thermophila (strain SB210) TaxID=312017 RepID=Q23DV6_TETTS|nr:dihydrolipoyl dehydrogenase [Tetrahymena thermophila SB210]EAR94529.2 dihydrolipoyl dehydrogenase [Tetrahymena thermophila SB210]|eukprot:XP_001014580.2 dihydrolipoyl dehydrogenase [Tetrahymena thermophila SB210]
MFKTFVPTRNLTHSLRQLFSTSTQYDVVVIGGGPGGYVAAIKAGQLGLKTACVEKRGSLGGTCLNVGCIPSKALLNISQKYYDASKHYKELGIEVEGVKMNWAQAQTKKAETVTGLTRGIESLFKKNKVDYFVGTGRLNDKNTIGINLNNGTQQVINSKNIIIATGSEPTPFPGLNFDEKVIISSTGALSLPQIPKKLIVIGAGVIGLEMGSVYQRLGTQVTVIEFADQICPFLDTDVAKAFQQSLKKQGLQILTGHKVVSGQNFGTHGSVVVEPVKGGPSQTFEADHILVSTGRRPYVDGLNAKEIGIEFDNKNRIITNSHLQTNIPNIYAIGDVIPGPMLAHKGEEEGIAAVEYIAGKGGHVNYDAIPSVIYTHPEVAWVGKTEQELKAANIKYNKGSFPMLANSRAKANNDYDGLIKILTEKDTDKLLGVHIMNAQAGELIGEATLAVEYGAAAEDIGRTCHAHPTISEALKEACMAAYDKPIHF